MLRKVCKKDRYIIVQKRFLIVRVVLPEQTNTIMYTYGYTVESVYGDEVGFRWTYNKIQCLSSPGVDSTLVLCQSVPILAPRFYHRMKVPLSTHISLVRHPRSFIRLLVLSSLSGCRTLLETR